METPRLSVKDISVRYRTDRGPAAALERVTLTLKAGENLGLVEESGCAKGPFSRRLLGFYPTMRESCLALSCRTVKT